MSFISENTKLSGNKEEKMDPKVIFNERADMNALEVFLKGTGCRYRKCSFCSFPKEAYQKVFCFKEWEKVLVDSFSSLRKKDYDEVFLYAYGNVLDKLNIPEGVLEWIVKHIKSEFQRLKIISIENRVEKEFGFTEEKLRQVRELVEPKLLEVAVGYETSNEKLREELLKKGIDEREFVGALRFLSDLNCGVRVYLLYPASPFLTEKEAFEQLKRDIEHLINLKEKFSLRMRIHICKLELKEGTSLRNLFNGKLEVNFQKVKKILPEAYKGIPFIFSIHPD